MAYGRGENTPLRAFVVSADHCFTRQVLGIWDDAVIQWTVFGSAAAAVDELLTDPPDLLVSDAILPDMRGEDLVALVKGENVYRQIPAVLCMPRSMLYADVDWSSLEVDDCVLLPFGYPVRWMPIHLPVFRAIQRSSSSSKNMWRSNGTLPLVMLIWITLRRLTTSTALPAVMRR